MKPASINIIVGLFLVSSIHAEELSKQAQADQAAKVAQETVVAPLPAGDEQLEALRARMIMLQKSQSEYTKALSEGKVKPFPEIQAAWPSYQEKAQRVSKDTIAMAAEKDPAAQAVLAKGIYALLQEIGQFLKAAEYLESPSVPLTKAQVDEMARLEKAWNEAESVPFSLDNNKQPQRLEILTPLYQYTIKHLAVNLVFKAPAGSKIYVDAGDGGLFSNGLAIAELTAAEDGLASVLWVSDGRGVDVCEVGVRAPGLRNEMPPFQIRVVQPVLEAPAYLHDLSNQTNPPAELNSKAPKIK